MLIQLTKHVFVFTHTFRRRYVLIRKVPPRVSHNNVFSPKTSGVLGIVYHYDESHSDFFSEFFEAF